MKKSFLVLIATAVTLAFAAFWRSSDHETQGTKQTATSAPSILFTVTKEKLGNTKQEHVNKAEKAAVAVEKVSPSLKLASQFRTATDWRAFALEALRRPEEGGYFYGMMAVDFCGMSATSMPQLGNEAIAAAVSKTGTVTPASLKLIETFFGRCASFSKGEAGEIYGEVKKSALGKSDPILNAIRDLDTALRGSNKEAVEEALRSLLSQNDASAPYKNMY